MNNLMTVHQASEKIGLSSDTIRRWEKKGLIRSNRDENNYRLFSLSEIQRVHKKISTNNGDSITKNRYRVLKTKEQTPYTVVDLFSGAGGTALGLENAGLKHVMLVEYEKNSAATLKENNPEWNVVCDDVKKVSFKGIKADVVEGGFPCQAFSYAGKKQGFEDTRGTLFFEFARCIKEIRPKVAIGENVRGLLKHDNGRTLQIMIAALNEIGYNVAYKVLRSQYHDVPQKRERLVILATRKDLKMPIFFPKEKDYIVSVREALENCPKSEGQEYSKKKEKIMKLIPPGGYWRDLPENLQKEYMGASYYMGGGKTGMARRLAWDEPSLTLTCNPAQKQTERCHPKDTRPLTVREYARIQVFPDDWKFSGSVSSQYKQIGNAVPVNLGYHIGRCVVAMLSGKFDAETMEIVQPVKLQQHIL